MKLPSPSEHSRHWDLDPSVVFLNHGSFGACPRTVLAAQREFVARMEREPVLFVHRDLEGLLDVARGSLASFLGADADDLAFVPNATAGVNTVLRSLRLEPGDEVVTTDHEYNACRNALDMVAQLWGARVVVAQVPFPLQDPAQVVDALTRCITPRTRLLLVDHVTSPTGMVLPVDRIVAAFAARGVDTLVDGAHAPGMLPLELRSLGAAYYTGNCHKWLCTPKGSAFLFVRRDRQAGIRPLAISHGANSTRTDRSRFRLEFDFTGTCDASPWLAIPAALDFLSHLLPGGIPALMAHNRSLALRARDLLCNVLGTAAPCPDSMIGSLASIVLPPLEREPVGVLGLDPLQLELWERWRVEIPVMRWASPRLRMLRVSPQAYNSFEQYEYLGHAVLASEAALRRA
ncbi:MAG: hypothetical protein RL148_847 [Planctomycetota bacterium]|jgi:isopenicillin-N epimerase